ncbi:right-handed parallel beta-helix repeat-containing protein [bacterium]|nr:right-handed parallel beta-helix repeat-containing protein [bacterium]
MRVRLVSVALLVAFSCGHASTVHVPLDEPTIQAGIDAASPGDTVEVSCGTYYEHDIVMKSGVRLTSETGDPGCVTIDAGQLGRCLLFEDAGDSTHVRGFTMTAGDAPYGPHPWGGGGGICMLDSSPHIEDCIIAGNTSNDIGGGVSCLHSAPRFSDCVIEGNTSEGAGGGFRVEEGSLFLSRCDVTANATSDYQNGGGVHIDDESVLYASGCTFSENEAGWHGGALYVRMTSAVFDSCSFVGNTAKDGAAVSGPGSNIEATDCLFADNSALHEGGGLNLTNAEAAFTRCRFVRNSSYWGGAICCWSGSSPTVMECVFEENSAHTGGAFYAFLGSEPIFTASTFANNVATGSGGAVDVQDCSLTFQNCTFTGNSAPFGSSMRLGSDYGTSLSHCILGFGELGSAVWCYDAQPLLSCCDVFGNAEGDWVGCLADLAGSAGNLCADPLFCGEASVLSPYALSETSPCGASANPDCSLIGAWPVACDLTVVRPTSWTAVKSLYRQ